MFGAVWVRRSCGVFAMAFLSAVGRRCRGAVAGAALGIFLGLAGCTPTERVATPDEQHVIDRKFVEYPAGFELRRFATGFTAATAMAYDPEGPSLLVAEGERGDEPLIWRVPLNGGKISLFYPPGGRLPLPFPSPAWRMFGPIGGMVVVDGKVIVTHRDENGMGVITALDRKGGHKTVVAGFPTQGDGGLTDLAVNPLTGELWFGCGTATNSGVVGTDNWGEGWLRVHPDVHDVPWHDIELLGYKFQSVNPFAGIFGPADVAVTAPFQVFNQSFAIRIFGSPVGKPGGAIYSVSPTGGIATVKAHGIHNPRGIVFNEYGTAYFTNDGMEMRGARPIKDDPDALCHVPPGQAWFGWPDFSTTLDPIGDARYQPPQEMIARTGYPEVRPLIDRGASGLTPPSRDTLLEAAFPSLSGAGKMDFAPAAWQKEYHGSVLITLSGDRSPFASGGIKLSRPVGFKIVRVDLDRHAVHDFIRNTSGLPRSSTPGYNLDLIERPVDVKCYGPDGVAYILDMGRMEVRNGREIYYPATGQIYRLVPIKEPATQPK
ncbi:MAG TPA: hypothetical protein VG269_13465 [Tepidisphaeraceae bacterium]|nr:hypothetical protein [Tepidisphaeraceae bacterium]